MLKTMFCGSQTDYKKGCVNCNDQSMASVKEQTRSPRNGECKNDPRVCNVLDLQQELEMSSCGIKVAPKVQFAVCVPVEQAEI